MAHRWPSDGGLAQTMARVSHRWAMAKPSCNLACVLPGSCFSRCRPLSSRQVACARTYPLELAFAFARWLVTLTGRGPRQKTQQTSTAHAIVHEAPERRIRTGQRWLRTTSSDSRPGLSRQHRAVHFRGLQGNTKRTTCIYRASRATHSSTEDCVRHVLFQYARRELQRLTPSACQLIQTCCKIIEHCTSCTSTISRVALHSSISRVVR